MRILFLTRLYYPHMGGVENHVREVSIRLRQKGYKIIIVTEKFDKKLKSKERIDGIEIERLQYPKVKFLGLLYIWFWLFRNRKVIRNADIIHCHDVFVWFLPFRSLYPQKPVYTTFHGGQDIWPIPHRHIFYIKLATRLSRGTIAIGDFIEKYFGVKPNFVSYGGVDAKTIDFRIAKDKKQIIFIGRLEKATGVKDFIKRIRKYKGYKIDFIGDGSLKNECKKYGSVDGFTDPVPFLEKAEICFAGGYLAALEALAYKCRLWVGWNSTLKKDYWILSPFFKWADSEKVEEACKWAMTQTWENLVAAYLQLWKEN